MSTRVVCCAAEPDHLQSARLGPVGLSSPEANQARHVEILLPLPTSDTVAAARMLDELPSRGRALFSDLAYLSVLDVPADDGEPSSSSTASASRPHLAIVLRAQNISVDSLQGMHPFPLADGPAMSSRRYDPSIGRRIAQPLSRSLQSWLSANEARLHRTVVDGTSLRMHAELDRSSPDTDGWNDLDPVDLASRASFDSLDIDSNRVLPLVLDAVLIPALRRNLSRLRKIYAQDSHELLSSDLSTPRTFMPSLLGLPAGNLMPTALSDQRQWRDPSLPYTDGMIALLVDRLRLVNDLESQQLRGRTLIVSEDDCPTSIKAMVLDRKAKFLCGCIQLHHMYEGELCFSERYLRVQLRRHRYLAVGRQASVCMDGKSQIRVLHCLPDRRLKPRPLRSYRHSGGA